MKPIGDTMKAAVSSYLGRTGFPVFAPKAFFFDMDGVMFDSMPNHASAWQRAFADIHIDFPKYDAYMQEGRTGSSTINGVFLEKYGRTATEEEITGLYRRKSAYFEQCGEPVAMNGAADVLACVRKKGFGISLVTGSGQESLLGTLDKFFPGYFASGNVVCAFDVKKGKPDPEPYLMALEKAGLQPNEAVVVENAPLGVQAGTAAGIFTIAVNTGILDDKVLLQAGADLLLPDMPALKDLILRNF